jgi:hypothetical protein
MIQFSDNKQTGLSFIWFVHPTKPGSPIRDLSNHVRRQGHAQTVK